MGKDGEDRGAEAPAKLLYWLLAILVSINLSCVGYVVVGLRDVELRVNSIEASRWTTQDGSAVIALISKLNERFAEALIQQRWIREMETENRRRIADLEKAKR